MTSNKRLEDLIADQEKWIEELNGTLKKLTKYKDGTLPYNENQIDTVANAQAQLAQATKNIANAIRDSLHKNQPRVDRT